MNSRIAAAVGELGWKKTTPALTEALLILYKKQFADQGLTLDEATEEALYFGWIDGQLKSLDERRYTWLESAKTEKTRQTRIHTILEEIHGH